MGDVEKKESVAAVSFSLLYGAALTQSPLYSSTQNTYLLKGVAKAGENALGRDWLVNQTDHTRLFTALIEFVCVFLDERVFYLLQFLLAGVFAYSLYVIVRKTIFVKYSAAQAASFFFGLAVTTKIAPSLFNGLALQYLLGPYLQPSAFGVLILLSVALFLSEKWLLAIFVLIASAWFHPTYLLHAAFVVGAYMISKVCKAEYKVAATIGVVSASMVAPLVILLYMDFGRVDPTLLKASQAILAHERIPHHTLISSWFGWDSFARIAAMISALYLLRKYPRAFVVMFVPFVAALILSLGAYFSGNISIALLFPWRTSAWLVPISVALLLAFLIVQINLEKIFAFARLRSDVYVGCVVVCLVVLSAHGVQKTSLAHKISRSNNLNAWLHAQNFEQGSLLIPVDLEDIRLNAKVPIFVDWKSHPYRADEVIEWHQRAELAKTFFGAKSLDALSAAAKKIQRKENIEYFLVPTDDGYGYIDCPVLFRDERYMVRKVKGCLLSIDSESAADVKSE